LQTSTVSRIIRFLHPRLRLLSHALFFLSSLAFIRLLSCHKSSLIPLLFFFLLYCTASLSHGSSILFLFGWYIQYHVWCTSGRLLWFDSVFAPLFASDSSSFLFTFHLPYWSMYSTPTLCFCFRPSPYTQLSDQLPMSLFFFFSITIIIIITQLHSITVRFEGPWPSKPSSEAASLIHTPEAREEMVQKDTGHALFFFCFFSLSLSFLTLLSTSISHLCLSPSLLCLPFASHILWFACHGGAGSAGYLLVVGASTDESKRHVCRRTTTMDTLWVAQSHSFTSTTTYLHLTRF